MASADFSQFVVTTADGTACETSTLKVLALSPHLPATSTGTSNNFWTSSICADLSVFPSLICGSCPSGQGFAYSFLQIPPHDGHPCCLAMYFVVAYAYSGLSPVRARPWRANTKKDYCLEVLYLICWFALIRILIFHAKATERYESSISDLFISGHTARVIFMLAAASMICEKNLALVHLPMELNNCMFISSELSPLIQELLLNALCPSSI